MKRIVTPDRTAANDPFGASVRGGELTITRLGTYTRIVLTKRERQPASLARPRRA